MKWLATAALAFVLGACASSPNTVPAHQHDSDDPADFNPADQLEELQELQDNVLAPYRGSGF